MVLDLFSDEQPQKKPEEIKVDYKGFIANKYKIPTRMQQKSQVLDLFAEETPVQQPKGMTEFFEQKVPESVVKTVGAMAQPIIHPIETGKNIAGLALGTLSRVVPGLEQYAPYADQLGDYLLNRYGSWENIKKTAYEDPVGFSLDLSTGLGIGGVGLKLAGLPKTAGVVSKAAEITAGVPIIKGTSKIVESLGKSMRILPKDSIELMTRAIKPSVKKVDFNTHLENAMPELQRVAEETGKPITNITELQDVIQTAKKDVWNKYEQILQEAETTIPTEIKTVFTIDANKIADAMESTISKHYEQTNKSGAQKIREIAQTYREKGTLGVREAEDYLQEVNNELESYYRQGVTDRNNAARNPNFAYIVKEAETIRNLLYEKLETLTGKDAVQIKKLYGSLKNLEPEVNKRAIVAGRAQPISLQEQIHRPWAYAKAAGSLLRGDILGAGEAAGQLALSKYIKQASTTDNMIKKAFELYGKSPSKPFPAKTIGQIGVGAYQTGRIGQNWQDRLQEQINQQ